MKAFKFTLLTLTLLPLMAVAAPTTSSVKAAAQELSKKKEYSAFPSVPSKKDIENKAKAEAEAEKKKAEAAVKAEADAKKQAAEAAVQAKVDSVATQATDAVVGKTKEAVAPVDSAVTKVLNVPETGKSKKK
ncbi:MAG: hypothetical protein LBC64_02060 [Fibromonadaceae bacterium]|jgi:colicin import membrane protein|nr:hypothetical protein [Fibromonadaceae bacterium]